MIRKLRERFYRWRIRLALRRMHDDGGAWFLAIAWVAFTTAALVLSPGCAARQQQRSIARIEARCEHDLAIAASPDVVPTIQARCHQQIDEVTRGR